MEMKTRFVLRNDSMTNWNENADSIVLLKGEPGIEFINGVPKLKIGNGIDNWKNLRYVQADIETWGDFLGQDMTGESSLTSYYELLKPGLSDSIDIRALNSNTDKIDLQLAVANSRVSNLIKEYSAENVDFDSAELLDIRVGYDGTTYTAAGDAVRAIGYSLNALRNDVADFVGSKAVDGLYYEGNKLYLTSKGVIVSDPVEIVSGSGGGGGGGGSTYFITLTNLMDSRVLSIAKGEEVKLEFDYSSVDDDNYDDGPGICYITVNNVSRATLTIQQEKNTVDINKY